MLKINLLTALFLLALAPVRLAAQHNDATIINSLNKAIKPIETLKADSSFSDINFLKETLKDKELIALGEVTHGTAEVFNYKDRLVRFLVANLGYRAIAFEADYIAIENIDNYITGKADSVVSVAGTAIMLSNSSMIEWLRAYNRDKSDSAKVHIYGLEIRNYTNIFKKLLEVIPDMETVDKALMETILARPFNSVLTKQDIKGINLMITRLQAFPLSELNMQYVEMLSQFVNGNGQKALRDAHMAKNASWLKERARDNKVIIWAHNGHVAKTQLYNHLPMGYHLDKKYGSKYGVIASDFNSGKARVNVYVARNKPMLGSQPYFYPEVPSAKWYEYFFSRARYKNFILDINAASKDPVLNHFLTQPLEMRMIGASQIPFGKKLSISKNFDMIVYFDKTSSM